MKKSILAVLLLSMALCSLYSDSNTLDVTWSIGNISDEQEGTCSLRVYADDSEVDPDSGSIELNLSNSTASRTIKVECDIIASKTNMKVYLKQPVNLKYAGTSTSNVYYISWDIKYADDNRTVFHSAEDGTSTLGEVEIHSHICSHSIFSGTEQNFILETETIDSSIPNGKYSADLAFEIRSLS